MKKGLLNSILGIFASTMMFACITPTPEPTPPNQPDPPTPPVVTVGEHFGLEVTKTVFDGCTVKFTPKNETQTYYYWHMPKAEYDKYTDDAAVIAAEIQGYKNIADLLGKSLADLIKSYQLLSAGPMTIPIVASFDAENEYYIYAFDLNADGVSNGQLDKIKIKTPVADPVVPSNLTVAFKQVSLSSSAVTLSCTPSDLKALIFTDLLPLKTYNDIGGTPLIAAQLVEKKLADFAASKNVPVGQIVRANCDKGIKEHTFKSLTAATKYIAVAVAFDSQGRLISDAKTFEFETPGAATISPKIAFENIKYYDGDELFAIDPVKYKTSKGSARVYFSVSQSAETTTWKIGLYPSSALAGYEPEVIIGAIDKNGYVDIKSGVFIIDWNEANSFVGFGIDANGNKGDLARVDITCVTTGVSPISDIVKTPASAPLLAPMRDIKILSTPVLTKQLKVEVQKLGM